MAVFFRILLKIYEVPLKECVTRVMILSHAQRQIQIFNQFQAIV